MRTVKTIIKTIIFCAIIFSVVYFLNIFRENEVLKKIIERLSADARIAEVMVTHV